MSFVAYARRLAPVAFGLILLTCGGGSPSGPAPTPSTTLPPTTQPTPPPVQSLCQRLGYTANPDPPCRQEAAAFQDEVLAAIDKLQREKPELFENTSSGLRIRSTGGYYVGLIDNLNAAGLCAGFDGEEIQVKDSNDLNEQYDVSSSSGYVRRDNIYRTTCRPAAFPTPEPPPIPPPAGCRLPSSREVACGTDTATFLGDVEASIDQVYQQHPDYFDFGDNKKGTQNSYKVRNVQGYTDAMEAAMAGKGFCARFDGEELVVKNTNDYSDHYDIITGDDYVRRGTGAYRVSCYPAAF